MTTTQATAASGDAAPVEIIEPDPEHYVRAAGDIIEVVAAVVLFLFTLLGAAVLRALFEGAGQDVVYLTSLVPPPIARVMEAVVGTMGFMGPVVIAVELVIIRRARVAAMVVGAALLAAGGMWAVSRVLTQQVVLPANLGELQRVSTGEVRWVAAAAAIITVINPWLPRLLRRTGITLVTIVVVTRLATGSYVPYEAAVALVLGWMIGSGVLAVFGSVNRRPSGPAVVDALQTAGVEVTRLEMTGGGLRGSTIYCARTADGKRRFVKVFDPNQRETDMLVQLYRWLRLREPSDQRPFTSLRRSVEHEALLALAAMSDGVSTAPLRAVAEVEPDGMLLAFDWVEGEPIDGRGPDGISDELLRRTWAIHSQLRAHRLAHRELRTDHVLVDRNGLPTVVDFSYGLIAAGPDALNSDAAELLCSTAIEVGPERAVAAAADALGVEVLAAVSGRVQPLALSRVTRKRLRERDGLLKELQAEIQSVAGLDEVQYEELARLKPRTLVTIVVGTVAVYALLPQLAEARKMGDELSGVHWIWLVPLIISMVSTWVGATVGVIGSVPERLPFWPTMKAQIAASFVDILAPASLGGMALNTRFMQKRGIAPAVAVTGVGLNAVAGFVIHIVMLGVFILWAGSSDVPAGPVSTGGPADRSKFVIGAMVIGVAALVAWLVPFTRELAKAKIVPLFRDAMRGIVELARKPRKLVALFAGSLLVTLGFYGALLSAVQAWGGGAGAAQIGVAYMVAFAVALLFPTPGGTGALEPLLILSFKSLGMSGETAIGSIFLFRAGTFWLPVLPGWLSFRSLQRNGEL